MPAEKARINASRSSFGPIATFLTGSLLWFSTLLPCLAQPVAAVAPPDVDSHYQKTCITSGCHNPEANRGIPRHSPFLEGRCLACHVDHSQTVPKLLRPGGDGLCLACHTKLEKGSDGVALKHAAEGKACLDCHSPHESRVRGLLRNDEDLQRCAQCHQPFLQKTAQFPYRHEHFEPQTMCGDCHYAHQRSDKKYLRTNAAETCLTCHDLPIQINGRQLENVAQETRTLPYKHGALEQGSCPTCHTPHGSVQPSLLVAGYPAGAYQPYKREDYALCWKCHDAKMVESASGIGVTGFRNKDVNLHRVHVVELKRGRGCVLCHEAHASEQAHLLRQDVRFGQWNAPLTWTATPTGGTCATPCHRQREYSR